MNADYEKNIETLHRCLKQLFIDYLSRVKAQGVAEEDIYRVLLSYLENGYKLDFLSTITPEKMYLVCSINGSNLFNVDFGVGQVTYQ